MYIRAYNAFTCKVTAKGRHLGLDSILKNPFGSLVWASVAWKPGTAFIEASPPSLGYHGFSTLSAKRTRCEDTSRHLQQPGG